MFKLTAMIPGPARQGLLGVLVLGLMLGGISGNVAQAGCDRVNSVLPHVKHLDAGVHKRLTFPTRVTRVAVGDPDVADLEIIGDRELLLTGVDGGLTSVYVWTTCNDRPDRTLVIVSAREALQVHEAEGSRDQVADLPMQVQADIRLVEVSRSKLREMGGSILGRRGSANFLFGGPGSVSGSVAPGGVGDANVGLPASDSGFNIFYGGGGSRFLSMINALEANDFAYTLAEPSLVALSGQSATFHAGGEFPVPVPSSGSDTINIRFKEFGVRVSFTPTVIDGDRLTLKVAPEVSELDDTSGIEIAGTRVPGLRVRRTDTTVTLGDGESFVISGLVSNHMASQVDKFPGLGNIPVLGAFFRSSRVSEEDRELLMIVTPHLVQPLARDAEQPPLPGEDLRDYRPSWTEQFFLEDGSFESGRSGGGGRGHGE
ncbi:type II and III secretion system protein family protein [Alkalilimnicola ehrlichii MLHE-1]|uniref:Type II and III secretion system protein n=1 Tax=Alkalilimnicola ehrlichii (strain ATCC BAA-1101 / DSM 17681 / MLHE-1) TaxID=187272 RepID=Q0A6N3_ALKEH|nr:type II and III secretion system protein family protein [Alkalilimnicola ehrlichii]ABI57504.1 type II and III secretion system protein [Alkalilimnicola ehrlichii MLHE-1]